MAATAWHDTGLIRMIETEDSMITKTVSQWPWGEPIAVLRHLTAPQPVFSFGGRTLPYFMHAYHSTYRNERTIEIPVALSFISKYSTVLEVGNVLNHYVTLPHDVVDKYEVYPGVINADVVDFTPATQYDLVLSISTLEHVGWDEKPQDPRKVITAISRMLSFVKPGGRMVFTVPIGWNPHLDQLLFRHEVVTTNAWYMKRINRQEWEECSMEDVRNARIGDPYWCANGLIIAEICPTAGCEQGI
jgi:hypothetical protein